jgi:hypothetical protein
MPGWMSYLVNVNDLPNMMQERLQTFSQWSEGVIGKASFQLHGYYTQDSFIIEAALLR